MTVDGVKLLWNGCKVAMLLLRYMCSHSCTACADSCMQCDDVCISVPLGQCLHNTEAKMSPGGREACRFAQQLTIASYLAVWLLYCSHYHTGALYTKVKGALIHHRKPQRVCTRTLYASWVCMMEKEQQMKMIVLYYATMTTQA